MLQLSEEQVKEILLYLNEIPTKYALPLINFLDQIKQQQQQQEEEK